MEYKAQKANTSHTIESPYDMAILNYNVFEALYEIFIQVDWATANVSMYSSLKAKSVVWKSGEKLCKGLHFVDKAELQTIAKQYSIDMHYKFKAIESQSKV